MSIGERIRSLLTIAMDGSPSFSFTLTCPHEDCREPMEISLSMETIMSHQDSATARETVSIPMGREIILLRKPTGLDQKGWSETSCTSEEEAVKAIISTLRSSDSGEFDFSRESIEAINEAMDEADPLVNFSIEVKCPHCENQEPHYIDLETVALSRLRRTQNQLIWAVHTLASHYHWSEHEILSLPPWRRSHYLSLIEQQETS